MKVEVCLTPELIHQHELEGKTAVVVDIFRATSCMISGLAAGVRAIYPVSEIDECLENGKKGMITAGERGGKKIEAFDIGNSPFDYMREEFRGREISVTTTNGTLAIQKSHPAQEVLIGAFLNLKSTVSYIEDQQSNVIIVCAGWKGTPNLEDTLYAGGFIEHLQGFEIEGDSALLAKALFQNHQKNLLEVARSSSHAQRLSGFGITRDIEHCLTMNTYDLVAKMDGKKIIRI